MSRYGSDVRFTLFIHRLFPTMNEALEVRGKGIKRTRKGGQINGWSLLKNKCEDEVKLAVGKLPKNQRNVGGRGPYHIVLTWVEWNQRRDPDNIASGGTKAILDALQEAGVLGNDGWKQIGRITHEFEVAETESEVGVRVVFYKDFEVTKRKTPIGRGKFPDALRIYKKKTKKKSAGRALFKRK